MSLLALPERGGLVQHERPMAVFVGAVDERVLAHPGHDDDRLRWEEPDGLLDGVGLPRAGMPLHDQGRLPIQEPAGQHQVGGGSGGSGSSGGSFPDDPTTADCHPEPVENAQLSGQFRRLGRWRWHGGRRIRGVERPAFSFPPFGFSRGRSDFGSNFSRSSCHPQQASQRLAFDAAYMVEGGPDGELVVCREDGYPLRPDYVTHRFKKLCRDAALPEWVHTHVMRHSFASLLADDGEGPPRSPRCSATTMAASWRCGPTSGRWRPRQAGRRPGSSGCSGDGDQ